ncbi:MAG: hypothetical protein KDC95_19355 [Planctomycetes bacterium]|nr:hypothetical protein [Planctomycetota bacterium]
MDPTLRQRLGEIVEPIAMRHGLARAREQRATAIRSAIPLLIVVPAVYAIAALVLRSVGVDFSLPIWLVVLLTLALPALVYAIVRAGQGSHVHVDRRHVLSRLDDALGLSDRMTAAWEFTNEAHPTPMMQAAIEDARTRVEAARAFRVDETAVPLVDPALVSRYGALAIVLVIVAALLPLHTRDDGVVVVPNGDGEVTDVAKDERDAPIASILPPERPREEPRAERPRSESASDSKRGDEGVTEKTQKQSRGSEGTGKSSAAQSTTGQSAGEGASTEAAQPTKGENAKKSEKKLKPPKDQAPKRKKSKKPEGDKKSVATTGQGKGKGSSRSPTASEWSSKDQSVAEDEEELEDEDEVDDEDDESEARGGLQPSLRQRKPPVNRDLSIGFGGGKPPPSANGRGGPGLPKKQRGVAQLVLGIPYPDQITGKPNKGRTKVTQERIDPQAQDAAPLDAMSRLPRSSNLGPLSRPVLLPWMQDVVRSYGLSIANATTTATKENDNGNVDR